MKDYVIQFYKSEVQNKNSLENNIQIFYDNILMTLEIWLETTTAQRISFF